MCGGGGARTAERNAAEVRSNISRQRIAAEGASDDALLGFSRRRNGVWRQRPRYGRIDDDDAVRCELLYFQRLDQKFQFPSTCSAQCV